MESKNKAVVYEQLCNMIARRFALTILHLKLITGKYVTAKFHLTKAGIHGIRAINKDGLQ